MKNITIADVAKAAGVSKATMSRFLNQNYSHMSDATREHIAKTVAELHYRPNRQAQALKSKHSNLIGVMVADIANIYSSLLLKGIGDILRPLNYQMLIMDSANSVNQEKQQLSQILDQAVDGIILQPTLRESAQYQYLADASIPLVMVDRETTPQIWHTITSDDYASSKRLAEELKAHQIEHATVIIEPLADASSREQRVLGFRAGAGSIPVDLIELPADRFDDLPGIVQRIAATQSHPAIFAGNGKMLMRLLNTIQSLGLNIPSDIGVVGYDDWNWAGLAGPGITTVEQDPDYIGRLAAETLIDLINGRAETPQTTKLQGRLQLRHSL